MVNNYNAKVNYIYFFDYRNKNIKKFDYLKPMSGPKFFQIGENLKKFRYKLKQTYKDINMNGFQFSDIIMNLTQLNLLLSKKSGFEKKILKQSKETINDDCYLVEAIDDFLIQELNKI